MEKKYRKIIIIVELFVILILVFTMIIFGLRKGIWDNNRFYHMSYDGNNRVYSDNAIEVLIKKEENEINIIKGEDNNVHLTFNISENGSYKSVKILSETQEEILHCTYNTKTRVFIDKQVGDSVIGDYILKKYNVNLMISDDAICSMALGNEGIRILGRFKDFIVAILFLTLSFSFNFLINSIVKLDKFFISIFYENSHNLKASEITHICLNLFGIAFFVIGVLLCKRILFT